MTIAAFGTDTATLAPSPASHAAGSIVQWASNLSTAAQAIRMIVDTPFMPQSFWPLPKGVTLRDWPTPQLPHPRETEAEYIARREIAIASGAIAVCKGDEVGLTPQAALESIYVVRGKPGMYAETMEALARSHGHEFVLEELTDRVCRMRGRHRNSETWQRFEFTIERARRAGYTRQNPKYDSDPQSMLHPRCRSIAVRGTCPEVLKGLRSVEEIEDDQGDDSRRPGARIIQRTPAPAALAAPLAATGTNPDAPTVHRQPAAPTPSPTGNNLAATPAGPPLPGEDEQPTQPPAEHGPIDERTWRAINAEFVKLGITGPGQTEKRMHVVCTLAGRHIARGNELTMAEGLTVLGTLQGNGSAVIADLLTSRPQQQPSAPQQPAAPAEPPLPGEDDDQDDDELDDEEDEYDPTGEQDWPAIDGDEAEGEAR